MPVPSWRSTGRSVAATMLVLSFLVAAPAQQAMAQQKTGDLLRRVIHEFVGIGGYWFTDSSARGALGSPKFSGDSRFDVKPAHRNNMLVTGGIELVGASDHWMIGGGNSFDLYGVSGMVSAQKTKALFKPMPFLTVGAFLGHIHSDQQNFKKTDFVGSGSVGIETKIQRYVSVKAQYRVASKIAGVRLDGFSVSLKFF